ncbi:unnamed protein product [Chironomus riparius]|uniref:Uncharacterized protein n=1 Tax=Chironomus riparius TaxID=315576 RepID=A0A9N9X0F1_9DIPT|nr:unnamed protein product [Chironomus riparius]
MILPLLTSILILASPLSALKCDFHIDGYKNYICELSNATPNEQSFTHTIDGYDDANVTIVSSIIDENSTLAVLDDFLMRKFENLRKIEISFFHVKEVAAGAFEVCDNIEEISLNRNDLEELPAGVFKSCKNLKILKLASNKFTRIPVDSFEGLDSLEVLKIDNNPLIEVMSDDFRYLTGLKQIFISGSGIKKFNDSNLGNLEVMDLRSNDLMSFEVRNALNLCSLNLSRNSLTSLRFSSGSNLTELDISMNSLFNLPSSIFKELNNLKILKLSWNPQIFKNTSHSIFEGLANLEVLEFKSCGITEISGSSFYSLDNLQELDLSHNSIQELPYIFSYRNLENLKVLKIASNSLKGIKSTTFMKLTSLTILDLSHNSIKKIGKNSFKFLENLEKLNLGSNRIEVLEINMFPGEGSKLVELDVSYNLIKAIEPGFLTRNLKILGADNPCVDESAGNSLDICFGNYEELKIEPTTTTTEATTDEKLDFSLQDLLITLICILFIAIVLIFIAFYINGILNLFGVYEKPTVKDDIPSSVTYQKF